jgi:hypothetical protein
VADVSSKMSRALSTHIKKHLPGDKLAHQIFEAMEAKNIQLLNMTQKDLDLLEGVYGKKVVKRKKKSR